MKKTSSTPLVDQLDRTRLQLNQSYSAPYGDCLRMSRKMEKHLRCLLDAVYNWKTCQTIENRARLIMCEKNIRGKYEKNLT